MRMIVTAVLVALGMASVVRAQRAGSYPPPVEGDYRIADFRFESGERLAELNLHYTTLGQPVRDERGVVSNAVLIMHGTTGQGRGFLSERFAGNLFGPGQLLDARRADGNDLLLKVPRHLLDLTGRDEFDFTMVDSWFETWTTVLRGTYEIE